ncbi:MAG: TIM barrel protein [Elusimicrobiaceae bacterium]|nr:TIM barrel protein [Elusimicrobiaceae bacterium]
MENTCGLVSVSFRENTPREILQAMNKAGLFLVEWGSDVHCPPEKAEEIAALQTRYGIKCCAYGTYFRLGETPLEELPGYIAAAKTLGTDILRLWCGDKNSRDYTQAERQSLFSACRKAAEIAEQADVILCMECHANTYTNTKEAALALMQAVNSRHFRMYWQPDSYRTEEENIAYAKLLAPYTENIHVFNWQEEEKYPLREAKDVWKKYLNCFGSGKKLLLEFMPDDRIESLKGEADALKEIAL